MLCWVVRSTSLERGPRLLHEHVWRAGQLLIDVHAPTQSKPRQASLLREYIARCIATLRGGAPRGGSGGGSAVAALTVLRNLLLLWGSLYGYDRPKQARTTGRWILGTAANAGTPGAAHTSEPPFHPAVWRGAGVLGEPSRTANGLSVPPSPLPAQAEPRQGPPPLPLFLEELEASAPGPHAAQGSGSLPLSQVLKPRTAAVLVPAPALLGQRALAQRARAAELRLWAP
jgi:hypothetical protein